MSIYGNALTLAGTPAPASGGTLLIASDRGRIITEARAEDYTPGNRMWNGWTITGQNSLTVSGGAIRFPTGSDARFDRLPASNYAVTLYALMRQDAMIEDWKGFFSAYYGASARNIVSMYSYNNIVAATAGLEGDVLINGIRPVDWHLYTMALNTADKLVSFYVDGVYRTQIAFNNTGNVIYLTTNNAGGSMDAHVKYAALVNGTESDAVIAANCQSVLAALGA